MATFQGKGLWFLLQGQEICNSEGLLFISRTARCASSWHHIQCIGTLDFHAIEMGFDDFDD